MLIEKKTDRNYPTFISRKKFTVIKKVQKCENLSIKSKITMIIELVFVLSIFMGDKGSDKNAFLIFFFYFSSLKEIRLFFNYLLSESAKSEYRRLWAFRG